FSAPIGWWFARPHGPAFGPALLSYHPAIVRIPQSSAAAARHLADTGRARKRLTPLSTPHTLPITLSYRSMTTNPSPAAERALELLQKELKLRFYSQRTIKVYRAHALAFLRALGAPPGSATDEDVRRYLLYLIEERRASRAYV